MTIDPALQNEIDKTETRWKRLLYKRDQLPPDHPRRHLLSAAMDRANNYLHYLQSCKNDNPFSTL